MHIAIIRTVFDRRKGGAERYAVGLARHWLLQGHRISVICAAHDGGDAEGMEVVRVSRPKVLGPLKHRWFSARAGAAARETGGMVLSLARAWPGDVLRLGDGLHRAWLGVRYPDLGSRRRALLNPRHRELLKLEQAMFLPGRFRAYVANSDLVRRQAVHMYGVEPSRVVVIPNGVDPARFNLGARTSRASLREKHGIAADAKVVLFSGMDFRRKGLDAAVEGFIRLGAEGIAGLQFVCVGRGKVDDARARLASAGLAQSALFLPASDEIEKWYGAADLFVLPTMHDPSANAVTEALACGLPVITSSENGARQQIGELNGRVLGNRSDPAELARFAAELLRSPPEPQAVALESQLISVAENAARLLQVLESSRERRVKPGAGAVEAEADGRGLEAAAARLGATRREGGLDLNVAGDSLSWATRAGAPGLTRARLSDILPDLLAGDEWSRAHGANRTRRLRLLRAYLWGLERPLARRRVLRVLRSRRV